ncbi:tetratricopeptide repeat protein [Flavobacterium sp. CYK-4]|uniref:tetratricopeptide repeat-containing sensor histidine kinase n=1 Tax=Flavobacterium lotistagni TaxID=2709660 RepID=UPI00140BF8C8|nr:histidine kinase dimerization/phosphoacceptor domain -containing protein [Flavobacterium lotistagni]NHM05871.1 tetratricopeptide repeat protein [Flavobacterium lotistagni]
MLYKKTCFVFLLIAMPLWSQNIQENFNRTLNKAKLYTEKDNDSAFLYLKNSRDYLANHSLGIISEVKLLEAEGDYYSLVKSNYNLATEKYLQGIKLCETHKLSYTNTLYHALGVLFHVTDNYQKAKYYYNKSILLSKQQKDTFFILRSSINLASVYSSLGNYKKAENLYKNALTYPAPYKIRSTLLANLGNMKIREKKYDEAVEVLKQVVAVSEPDAIDLSFYLDAKSLAREFSGADTIMKKADKIFEQTADLRDKSILLKSMGNMEHRMGNLEKAVAYKDQYIVLYDSLKAKQRDEVVYEMESKYQTEKKQQELLQKEKEKTQLLYLVFAAMAMVLMLSYLVWDNMRKKRKLTYQKQLLETAVDEKNILLKETHHRVKNSFQIVSSLLYLQSENMKDKEAALAVKEAQNRVKSMVLIHQKLYSKDQLIGIDSKEYMEDLVRDIIENQTDSIANLETKVTAESAIFAIDTITPLGLIINELITNCIKHAFTKNHPNPTIALRFEKKGEIYTLQVTDNGIGLSETTSENSFGLKLIAALAKKLKAKYSFENNAGTHFYMEIYKFEQMQ